MSIFYLRIIACDKVFYEGECQQLVFPVEDGEMAVLANHEPMTTCTEIGEVRLTTPEGDVQVAVVSDGFLKMNDNKVVFLVSSAERPEEIDALRAREALERAQEQLHHKQSHAQYLISRASLARAMARLSGKDKYVRK